MPGKNENSLKFSVFVVGFTTMITQIILLRFFLSVFSGNELVIGIIFANWMILTALGAYLARYFKHSFNTNFIFFSHILLGIFPILIGFLSLLLRNYIFPPGKLLDIIEIFYGSLILLSPFCILSGFLFSYFSTVLSEWKKSNEIYKIYSIEAIGSIVGGILFNFLFIFIFNAFFSLKLLLFLNFATALFLYFIHTKSILPRIGGIFLIAIAGGIAIFNINQFAYSKLFMNQTILEQEETHYGTLTVTEASGQINFFENGVMLFSSDNTIEKEENVHYAMLQHSKYDNVLVISGGVSETINEVLKYKISSIDYIEINPALIQLTEKHLTKVSQDNRINIINQDARLFLKKIEKKYDIVLINLPDPDNVHLNRYFSLEFFELIKRRLSYSGIVSISLASSANYMSEESINIHSSLYSTMKLIFENVIIIPGQRNYFIASESKLSSQISSNSKTKGIANEYVNHFYLDDALIAERQTKITDLISKGVLINYDFLPVTYTLQLKVWLNKFNTNLIAFGIIILLIFIFIITQLNIVNLGLFTTGFSAMSLEILLLIAFQIIYGYVYFMLGIFITIFMIGIVAGSLYLFKNLNITFKNFSFIQYLIGILSILIPIILLNLNNGHPSSFIVHSIFIVLMLIVGILTGIQFSTGTNLRLANISKNASGSYSSDLIGSALGALIAVTILIPYFGLIKVFLLVGIFNFITGLIVLITTRNR